MHQCCCECHCGEEMPTFWSVVVKPGSPVRIEHPDEFMLTITQVSMPELPADGSSDPVRLVADISNIEVVDGEVNVREESEVLLACLVPGVKEFQKISVSFSIVNAVLLKVIGKAPVHVTGYIDPLYPDSYAMIEEEEEEEEEEDDSDDDEEMDVRARLIQLTAKK